MRSNRMNILAAIAMCAATGCASQSTSAPAPATPPASQPPAATNTATASTSSATGAYKVPGEAKVGDKTKCLVMGDEFVVAENSPKVEHEGKTYYFCCPGCVSKFKENPAKYLGNKNPL